MSFDRLAPHYRWMEVVLAGDQLQPMRTAWWWSLPTVRRALLVGEGPGRFLVELLEAQPHVEVLYVDASASMIEIAHRQLRRCGLNVGQVHFQCAQLPHQSLTAPSFDLIVTHFFLDCFPPTTLSTVIDQLSAVATPDAQWLLADFCEPASGLGRIRARAILALMYRFFRVITRLPAGRLTPPDAFLSHAGFHLHSRRTADWGLLHSDWWRRTLC